MLAMALLSCPVVRQLPGPQFNPSFKPLLPKRLVSLAVTGLAKLVPVTTSRWSITVIQILVDRNDPRAENIPGIEYGDMQLIAEAYGILRHGLELPNDEIADIFLKWNKGVLDSFLIDITSDILKFKDDDGKSMVDKILDSAGQKGTGKWTAIASLEAGIPGQLKTRAYRPSHCLLSHSHPDRRGRLCQVSVVPQAGARSC